MKWSIDKRGKQYTVKHQTWNSTINVLCESESYYIYSLRDAIKSLVKAYYYYMLKTDPCTNRRVK